MKGLRPDEPDPAIFASVPPAAYDAQDPRQDGEKLPVVDQRLLVDAGIGDPDKGQDQNDQIGQRSEKTGRPSFLIGVCW